MRILFYSIKFKLIFIILIITTFLSISHANNLTGWRNSKRQRRTLIYVPSSTFKMVMGLSLPVRLDDPKPYRQLTTLYNMQAQYALPGLAQNLYTFTGRTLEKYQKNFKKFGDNVKDELRSVIYHLLEMHLEKNNINGRTCLQRAICENAQFNKIDGIFLEILHTTLTPVRNYNDECYVEAFDAGKFGADCLTLYHDCPKGMSFFDQIFITKTLK